MAAAHGDSAAALRHLDRAAQLHRPGFFPDVRPIPALRARLQLSAGDLAAAGRWARERGLSPTDPPEFLREYDHLTLVRLLLAQQRAHLEPDAADRALGLLEPLRAAATASGRAGSLVEIRLLTALAHDAQGRRGRRAALPGRRADPGPRAGGLGPGLPRRGNPGSRACCARSTPPTRRHRRRPGPSRPRGRHQRHRRRLDHRPTRHPAAGRPAERA